MGKKHTVVSSRELKFHDRIDELENEVYVLKVMLTKSLALEKRWTKFSKYFHTKGCPYIGDPDGLNCCEGSDAATNGMRFWAERDDLRDALEEILATKHGYQDVCWAVAQEALKKLGTPRTAKPKSKKR